MLPVRKPFVLAWARAAFSDVGGVPVPFVKGSKRFPETVHISRTLSIFMRTSEAEAGSPASLLAVIAFEVVPIHTLPLKLFAPDWPNRG